MKFFNRFRKKGEAQKLLAASLNFKPQMSPRVYEGFAREGYQQNVIAYRCIELISTSVAQIPMVLYKKGRNGEKTEIKEHPLLDLLKKPNPLGGQSSFFKSMTNYLLLDGNSYVEAVQGGGQVTELWTLRPDRMEAVIGNYGLPKQWKYKLGNVEKSWVMDPIDGSGPIKHIQLFSPLNAFFGMSPMQAAAMSIDQFNAQTIWNLALLQRGARPSGILQFSGDSAGDLTQEQLDGIKSDIQAMYSGSVNAGNVMILPHGLEWKDSQMSPKDMDYQNGKNGSASDIATALGVPHQLINVPGAQTYANFEQAMIFFYQFTVIPVSNLVLDAMNTWLVPKFGEGLELGLDEDKITALEPLRKAKWEKAQQSTFLTLNEKRELAGYGKYEDKPDTAIADQILVPSGQVLLSDLEYAGDEPLTDTEDVGNPDEPKEPEELTDTEDLEEDDEGTVDPEKAGAAKSLAYCGKSLYDIQTKAGRANYWRKQERRRSKYEQRMNAKVKTLFNKESAKAFDDVSKASSGMQENAFESAQRAMFPEWEAALSKEYELLVREYAGDVLSLRKHFGADLQGETKDTFMSFDFEGAFEEFVARYVKKEVAKKIRGIQKTSKKRVFREVRQAIEDGIITGQSNYEVAKLIKSSYSSFTKPRALTIARTETHSASQVAMTEAAKTLNVPNLMKEWVSAQDDRTREDHAMMNGAQVDLEERFLLVDHDSGEEIPMDQPGDPSAPAKQLINCRCVTAFSKKR